MIKTIRIILRIFAENNLFHEGVALIGSWCFQMYQEHLDVTKYPLLTQDVDFLIPNPFQGKEHPTLIDQLQQAGFHCDFYKDGSLYLWNSELKIEFLTPEKGRGVDGSVKFKKLGINAIPLRYVDLLLSHPITIVDDGIKVLVPHPVNFCLHKLLISSRRTKANKNLKDIQQVLLVSQILEKGDIQRVFKALPKPWKLEILRVLEKSKRNFPLALEDIEKIEHALQDLERKV